MMLPSLGAERTPEGVRFRLWSTRTTNASVVLYDPHGVVTDERPLAAREEKIFEGCFADVAPNALYKFRLDGRLLPDPYARFVPLGVHGPAQVWESDFLWQHDRPRRRLADGLSTYELHVGTFTPAGTFAAAMEKLPYVAELGVDAIELLPLSSFPGRRGWGYDGVAHFAPYAGYGTPDELRALIDAAHGLGLVVIHDVVYNHFGPDGNYLASYSPEYFTSRVQTPWGDSPAYAEPHMRRLVLENVRYWLESFRFDGLRLDATHAIHDESDPHLLTDLAAVAHAVDPALFVIAEDEQSRTELLTVNGLDGVWADELHHQIHILLTGERDGYYSLYDGTLTALGAVIAIDGRARIDLSDADTADPRGTPADPTATAAAPGSRRPARGQVEAGASLTAAQLITCIQNHDQVGNRALGERLSALVPLDAYVAVSTLLLFLPMSPLLFMGQEWAATTPFLYFTDHHEELGRQVSQGRRAEFKHFEAFASAGARERIPDPQSPGSFAASKLQWEELDLPPHRDMLAHYRRLLRLRRTDPVLRDVRARLHAGSLERVLWVRRANGHGTRLMLVNFGRDVRLAAIADALSQVWPDEPALTRALHERPLDLVTGRSDDALRAATAIVIAAPAAAPQKPGGGP